jgi:hypothetical protein
MNDFENPIEYSCGCHTKSISDVYTTNEEEQNVTACIHISLTQNIYSQARCTSPPIDEAGDQSQCCNYL